MRLGLASLGVLVCALLITAECGWASPADRSRFDTEKVSITRHFASLEMLQIHYRMAIPMETNGAGHRPVIALHQSPNSSQMYVEFMGELGSDRVVYAPDTPGFGESDVPSHQPTVSDYADWMLAFANHLNLNRFDLVGYHTGATIAVEMATLEPTRVHSLVLVGLAAFTPEEQADLLEKPWPRPSDINSDYLVREWEGSKSWQGQGQSDKSVERTFLAKIGAGKTAWWGPSAVFRYPLLDKLSAMKQPVTIVRPKDDLWDITVRAKAAVPRARFIDMPEYGFGTVEIVPAEMAAIARQQFDQPEN